MTKKTILKDTFYLIIDLILSTKKPAFRKIWLDNNVITVKDLLKDDGTIMTYNDFVKKYKNIKSNFLQFYQMISAIPKRLFIQGKNVGWSR